MRKIFVLFSLLLLMFSNVCSAERSDYVSPNFSPKKIHNIVILPSITNGTQYVSDPNIQLQFADELKKNWKMENTKIDTLMEVMKKVQDVTGKNVFVMMQSNNQELMSEAQQLCVDYVKQNYDTQIVIEVAIACEGNVFREGITYNTTSYQTSTSNVTSRGSVIPWATITTTTPVQQQHTIGRGMRTTASIGMFLRIFDMSSGEKVFERMEARYKESAPRGHTTPADMGKRIVNKFSDDISDMAKKK